ncbi:MAG: hypothetical protein LBV23_09420 [Deltaproteobacteria bacterium]|nr:hypothetical protein [Deltaproteobacteria bacterium]
MLFISFSRRLIEVKFDIHKLLKSSKPSESSINMALFLARGLGVSSREVGPTAPLRFSGKCASPDLTLYGQVKVGKGNSRI